MNVRIPEMDITGGSLVVQWDAVTDFFAIEYTVSYYGEHGSRGWALVLNTGLTYTITRLRNNTYYNVTVAARSTCCGTGPDSEVVMVMTNLKPTTLPPTMPTSSTSTPGNFKLLY